MLDPHQNWSRDGLQHFYDGFHIFRCSPGCRNVPRAQSHISILADQFEVHQHCQLSYRC